MKRFFLTKRGSVLATLVVLSVGSVFMFQNCGSSLEVAKQFNSEEGIFENGGGLSYAQTTPINNPIASVGTEPWKVELLSTCSRLPGYTNVFNNKVYDKILCPLKVSFLGQNNRQVRLDIGNSIAHLYGDQSYVKNQSYSELLAFETFIEKDSLGEEGSFTRKVQLHVMSGRSHKDTPLNGSLTFPYKKFEETPIQIQWASATNGIGGTLNFTGCGGILVNGSGGSPSFDEKQGERMIYSGEAFSIGKGSSLFYKSLYCATQVGTASLNGIQSLKTVSIYTFSPVTSPQFQSLPPGINSSYKNFCYGFSTEASIPHYVGKTCPTGNPPVMTGTDFLSNNFTVSLQTGSAYQPITTNSVVEDTCSVANDASVCSSRDIEVLVQGLREFNDQTPNGDVVQIITSDGNLLACSMNGESVSSGITWLKAGDNKFEVRLAKYCLEKENGKRFYNGEPVVQRTKLIGYFNIKGMCGSGYEIKNGKCQKTTGSGGTPSPEPSAVTFEKHKETSGCGTVNDTYHCDQVKITSEDYKDKKVIVNAGVNRYGCYPLTDGSLIVKARIKKSDGSPQGNWIKSGLKLSVYLPPGCPDPVQPNALPEGSTKIGEWTYPSTP